MVVPSIGKPKEIVFQALLSLILPIMASRLVTFQHLL